MQSPNSTAKSVKKTPSSGGKKRAALAVSTPGCSTGSVTDLTATTPKTPQNPTPKQLAKKEEAARRKANREKEREEAKAEKERQRLEEKLAKERKRDEERARKEAEKVEKERLKEEERARKENEKVEKERMREEEKNKKEEVSGANMWPCNVVFVFLLPSMWRTSFSGKEGEGGREAAEAAAQARGEGAEGRGEEAARGGGEREGAEGQGGIHQLFRQEEPRTEGQGVRRGVQGERRGARQRLPQQVHREEEHEAGPGGEGAVQRGQATRSGGGVGQW